MEDMCYVKEYFTVTDTTRKNKIKQGISNRQLKLQLDSETSQSETLTNKYMNFPRQTVV